MLVDIQQLCYQQQLSVFVDTA